MLLITSLLEVSVYVCEEGLASEGNLEGREVGVFDEVESLLLPVELYPRLVVTVHGHIYGLKCRPVV